MHRCYRIHAVDNRAVVSEDALMLRAFERRGFVGRPCATVLLEGTARLSAHDRTEWLDGPRAMLMTAESASAEYVSRVVGYRSPQSFARALQLAGLPAPAQIRAEIQRFERGRAEAEHA